MDQAARHLSIRHYGITSKTVVLAYFVKILTPDRWTPIPANKVATEVGLALSTATKAIQALVADGKVLRQHGHGRKDACAYRLPKPPTAAKPVPAPTPRPVKPKDSLSETIRNMREMERMLNTLDASSISFNTLLKARGDLLELTAALRSENPAEAIERLDVLFDMVSPFLDEVSIEGQIVQAVKQDFRAFCRSA